MSRPRSPTATSSPRAAATCCPSTPSSSRPRSQSGEVSHHPIVIVGGGLAGLTLACALARYGVPAVLLDEDNTVGVKGASSRGICYTQKSLEIFERLGVYERIAAKGIQWSVGRTFAGKDEVYSFDLRQQSAYNLSSQPPFINIQQFYIEGFLVERIQRTRPRGAALEQPRHRLRAGRRRRHADRRHAGRRLPHARRPRDRRHRLAQPVPRLGRRLGHGEEGRRPLVHRRRALHQAPAGGAPHLDRGAVQREPRRLAAPDGRQRLAHRLPDGARRRPGRGQPRGRGARAAGAAVRRGLRASRSSGSAPTPTAANAWTACATAACSSWATRPRWSAPSARAAATPASPTPTTWPGSWPPC